MQKATLFVLSCLLVFLSYGVSLLPGLSGRAPALETALAQEDDLDSKKIVPFVPTPQEVVERMLAMAQIKKGDLIYDLGSGDGRIVITAAKKYGVKAVGFEIDPDLLRRSRDNARKAGVAHLTEFREQDILTVDLSPASVVTMYLLPEVNLELRPKIFSQLKRGARVVSHEFDMGDWKPRRVEVIKDRSGWDHTIFLWVIADPAKRDMR